MNLKLLKNLNVLYVEDNAVVAEQTGALLEGFFHHVFYKDNAEDALEFFNSELVHVVITDIELPGMNGLQFCEEIRKINTQIPIFITTMHNRNDLLRGAVKLKLVDYLIKPVSVSTLTKTLSKSLNDLIGNGDLSLVINNNITYYPLHHEMKFNEETISLTQSEAKLLNLLIRHKNQPVDSIVIEDMLSPDKPMSDAAFKNIIYRLRKKIGKETLVSVSGVGIKLVMKE